MKTLILLIQFFTRIPLPVQINMDEINLKKGSAFFAVCRGDYWRLELAHFYFGGAFDALTSCDYCGAFCRNYHYWRFSC